MLTKGRARKHAHLGSGSAPHERLQRTVQRAGEGLERQLGRPLGELERSLLSSIYSLGQAGVLPRLVRVKHVAKAKRERRVVRSPGKPKKEPVQ